MSRLKRPVHQKEAALLENAARLMEQIKWHRETIRQVCTVTV
jgi:hypothetical protein